MAKYEKLHKDTGLSMSTIYRRIKKGYTEDEIREEAKIMKKYSEAGSNWKKLADKEKDTMSTTPALVDISIETKEPKEPRRVAVWEPADDYGLVSRLKVLGGWIVKVEAEVLFVLDPKHKWEV